MPKPRMPSPLTSASQRRLLFETWQQTGNVALACRTAGVGRRTFYYWKPRFDAGGFAALDVVRSSLPARPHQLGDAIVHQVIALRRAHPTWGKRRIANEVALVHGGVPMVSANTVKRVLVDAGLWPLRHGPNSPPAAPSPLLRSTEPPPHRQLQSPAGANGGPQPVPLLAVKLAPPSSPAVLIDRTRLFVLLDSATRQRLTLLSAAAGWGKTTLLSAWATRNRARVAWLSLDVFDNEVHRFWSAVIAALRTCNPTLGATALGLLQPLEPTAPEAVVAALLHDLAALEPSSPAVLILDDYHVLDDPPIHASVALLIERLPPSLRVVLTSRVDPDLPLARWRVAGYLAELRAADLGFDVADAHTFFTQVLGEELSDDDVQRFQQRTEGWAAGLQLAALALRAGADRAAVVRQFTGSHRYLMDYVKDEILQRQPLPIQRFLLQTAVLGRLHSAVCMALTGDPASQQRLEWLEHNNLFVVPLDEQRQWYRVHDLFREALLARLMVTEPTLIPRLHRRAAQWYARNGTVHEAIEHALAGADFVFAAELLEQEAPRMWRAGEAHAVHTWVAALPDAVVWQHARLALEAARHLLQAAFAMVASSYAAIAAQLESTLARLEALLQHGPPTHGAVEPAQSALPTAAETAMIERRVRLVRTQMEVRSHLARGDVEALRRLVDRTEELGALEPEVGWKIEALASTFLLVQSLERQGGLLIDRLREAKQQAIDAGDRQSLARVMRWLAFAYAQAGQLHLMEHETQAALALLEQLDMNASGRRYLYYLLAGCSYQWNQLAQAQRLLQQALHIARTWQDADLLVFGYLTSADVALAMGDLRSASEAINQAEELVQQARFATHSPWVVVARVDYWLAIGELEAAGAWATQMELSTRSWTANSSVELLSLLRVYLAQRRYDEACQAADRFSALLDRPGDGQTTIEYLVLRCVALHGAGRRQDARAAAGRLLALAEPGGYIRMFLSAGEPMRRVLEDLRDGAPGLDPVVTRYVVRLIAAFATSVGDAPASALRPHSGPDEPPPLVEPLTAREREVLRLLVTGASNLDIATTLVIALSTAKKHVSNILSKLGVASRVHAVARARELSELQ